MDDDDTLMAQRRRTAKTRVTDAFPGLEWSEEGAGSYGYKLAADVHGAPLRIEIHETVVPFGRSFFPPPVRLEILLLSARHHPEDQQVELFRLEHASHSSFTHDATTVDRVRELHDVLFGEGIVALRQILGEACASLHKALG